MSAHEEDASRECPTCGVTFDVHELLSKDCSESTSGIFDTFLSRCGDDCVNAVHCAEPHQGCGCARDASQGCHEGPCEYDVSSDDGLHVACVKCADASAEAKR